MGLKELLFGGNPPVSLDSARKDWKATISGKGGHCPCCGKWGKVYKHRITEAMAKSLLWMASTHGTEWIDMPRQAPRDIVQTYTFATLHWWGLIEQHPKIIGEDGDLQEKKFTGYWRVTQTGLQYAKGLVAVPKWIYLYDNQLMDMSDETALIRDAFGKTFNYGEVMQETWGADYGGQ